MTYKQFINLDYDVIKSMSDKELKKVVGSMRDAANKRIKRLQENKLEDVSPALQNLKIGGKVKPITTKVNSRLELEKEYLRANRFLRSKTSTVRGTKKFQKDFVDTVFDGDGDSITPEQLGEIFKAFFKFKNNYPELVSEFGSRVIMDYMHEKAKQTLSAEDIYKLAVKYFKGKSEMQ